MITERPPGEGYVPDERGYHDRPRCTCLVTLVCWARP